jgi:hypothetical protein
LKIQQKNSHFGLRPPTCAVGGAGQLFFISPKKYFFCSGAQVFFASRI